MVDVRLVVLAKVLRARDEAGGPRGETETERETEREKTERDRQRERQRQRETETETETKRDKEKANIKKSKKKSRKLPTGTDEHTIELVFTRKKMRKKESARKRTRIYGE